MRVMGREDTRRHQIKGGHEVSKVKHAPKNKTRHGSDEVMFMKFRTGHRFTDGQLIPPDVPLTRPPKEAISIPT